MTPRPLRSPDRDQYLSQNQTRKPTNPVSVKAGPAQRAASYTIGLAAHKTALGLPTRLLPEPHAGSDRDASPAPRTTRRRSEHIFMPVTPTLAT
jgi:hypothetical protein